MANDRRNQPVGLTAQIYTHSRGHDLFTSAPTRTSSRESTIEVNRKEHFPIDVDYLAPATVGQRIPDDGSTVAAIARRDLSAKPSKSRKKSLSNTSSHVTNVESAIAHPDYQRVFSTSSPAPNTIGAPTMAAPARPAALLIASLGNPPPYHSTRHSAGHLVLQYLRSSMNLPALTQKSRNYGGGHISLGADFGRPEVSLYQSASMMNVSGPPLLKAWKTFVDTQAVAGRVPGLVVLHDEMEIESGRIKVRRGNSSAKGHNGIKSVQSSLQGAGLLEPLGSCFIKIGIGIGRPSGGSRQTGDVSAYVLGQLTSREKDQLEQSAGEVAGVLYQELARIGQM